MCRYHVSAEKQLNVHPVTLVSAPNILARSFARSSLTVVNISVNEFVTRVSATLVRLQRAKGATVAILTTKSYAAPKHNHVSDLAPSN